MVRCPLRMIALLFLTPALPGVRASAQISTSADGSKPVQVRLRVLQTVSSAHAKAGQLIAIEAVEAVAVNGTPTIAAGAHGQAIVSEARRRGHNRRDGKLILTLLTVTAIDGRSARLQSATLREGGYGGHPIFGPCTFPFPADPVGLFRKGHEAVILSGTEITASVALTI